MKGLLGYAHPVLDVLDAAVPLEIRNLRGMDDWERVEYARSHTDAMQHGTDAMLMGHGRRISKHTPRAAKESVRNFAAWARVLAVLAYQPGGVNFGGRHWCADHEALCVRPLDGTPFERGADATRPGIPRALLDFAERWESAAPAADGDEGPLLCCRCLLAENEHRSGDCEGYSEDWDSVPTVSIGWGRVELPLEPMRARDEPGAGDCGDAYAAGVERPDVTDVVPNPGGQWAEAL